MGGGRGAHHTWRGAWNRRGGIGLGSAGGRQYSGKEGCEERMCLGGVFTVGEEPPRGGAGEEREG